MIKRFFFLVMLTPVIVMAQTAVDSNEQYAQELKEAAETMRAEAESMRLNEKELVEIEKALQANEIELIELERELGPEVSRFIRKSVIIDGRPILGISIGPVDGRTTDVAGVRVVGVTPGGPADEAGVVTGDQILRFDSTDLAAATSGLAQEKLLAALRHSEAGEPVALTIDRDGESLEVEVIPRAARGRHIRIPFAPLAPVPPGSDVDVRVFHAPDVDYMLSDAQRQWEGIELVELTPDLGRYFGANKGLLVVKKPSGDAVPLEEGDVIERIGGRQPRSVSQAMRILRSYDAGEELELEILREKRRRKLEIEIPEHD